MAKFIVVLAACIALSMADGPTPLEDLQKHAEEFSKTFTEQFKQVTSSKNTQEVNKALKEGSESVVQQLSALAASLQNALGDANGKAKAALEQSRSNIERTVADLRKAHPEVEQQASALQAKVQQAVQTAVQESQKLAKEVSANLDQANQKLAPQIKSAYDDFVKHAEDVQKKIHDAANKQ